MNSIITEGQSLVDVAMQELGTVAGLFDLADAAGLSITDQLSAGQVLPVPVSGAANAAVVSYYGSRGQRVNTGTTGNVVDPIVPTSPTGDYWADDYSSDFKIN